MSKSIQQFSGYTQMQQLSYSSHSPSPSRPANTWAILLIVFTRGECPLVEYWSPPDDRKWLADLIISHCCCCCCTCTHTQRHSGRCTQHVLLDPLDVHGGGRVYEKARLRSAIPGRGQLPEPGQCHYQAYEILSMGGVHAVFSGE